MVWSRISLFACWFRLQRPKDHIGDLETWAKAENDLEKALDDFGKPWVVCVTTF